MGEVEGAYVDDCVSSLNPGQKQFEAKTQMAKRPQLLSPVWLLSSFFFF